MLLMKVSAGIDAIRNNPKLYIGDCEPTGQFLGVGLAACALTSGAQRVQVELLDDDWVSVSAERDWITSSLPEHRKDWPLSRVVISLIPQVGGRQNEIRYEAIVSAFSRNFAVKSGDNWTSVVGNDPPDRSESELPRPISRLFSNRCAGSMMCGNPMAGIGKPRIFRLPAAHGRFAPVNEPEESLTGAKNYTSVCSAISSASSTSIPRVPDSAFELAVSEQELSAAQILRSPVNQGGFGTT